MAYIGKDTCFNKQFWKLIQEHKHAEVKSILDDPRIQHVVMANQAKLLCVSVKHYNIEILGYLLAKGCNVNAQDSDGGTALMYSAYRQQARILQILLSYGADIDIRDNSGEDALCKALISRTYPLAGVLPRLFTELKTRYTSEQIAQRLVDINCQLGSAAYSRDAKVIEGMILRGVPVNLLDPVDEHPLHTAVELGDLQTVQVLVKHGANVDAHDVILATPIFYLHCFNFDNTPDRLDILKILLARGASLTSCTTGGSFQVSFTLIRGTSELVHLVLQSITDFSARDDLNWKSILHCLAKNNNVGVAEVTKLYLEKFDINALDRRGLTALDLAVINGNAGMVKLLLDGGADIGQALLYAYTTSEVKSNDLHDRCAEILLSKADPQMIFSSHHFKKCIMSNMTREKFNRLKFALGELAMREKQGAVVSELALSKIHSRRRLKNHLDQCNRLLGKKICGTVSTFELLRADTRKMSKYLNNKKLALKLARIVQKPKLKTDYGYYCSILQKRVSDGYAYKALRNKASEIICEISGDRLSARNIATEKIIDYLNHQDLQQLCSL